LVNCCILCAGMKNAAVAEVMGIWEGVIKKTLVYVFWQENSRTTKNM